MMRRVMRRMLRVRAARFAERVWDDRLDLTPHEQWVMRQGHMEKPFTGRYLDFDHIGTYHCACCSAPLFLSEHKHPTASGYASFWASVDGAVNFDETRKAQLRHENVIDYKFNTQEQEYKNVQCRKCEAFIGVVFKDGLPPYFLRFAVNSASVSFVDKPFFENPLNVRKRRQQERFARYKQSKLQLTGHAALDESAFDLATGAKAHN